MKVTIYWLRKSLKDKTSQETIDFICERLSLPTWMSVNRETLVEVSEDVYKRLQDAEKQGFIQIRNK